MKNKIITLLASCIMAVSANAAVTFSFATQTGSANGPNGLPVVDANGAPILNSTNSLFASIGRLTAGPDDSIAGTLARFVALDNTPLTPNLLSGGLPRNGLFNGQDYSSATNVYPGGFVGEIAYVVIGNSSNILESTAIAMFAFTQFQAPDALGNRVQSFALTSASTPLFGTLRSVTVQPFEDNNASTNFAQGVMLQAIPETSTSLLGAIGALALLRRRRN